MPFVNPVTLMGEVVFVAVMTALPPLDVTVYPVITLPPLLVGALNATLAEAFPVVATTFVGALGIVAGVTAADAEEGAEFPNALVATIVKV